MLPKFPEPDVEERHCVVIVKGIALLHLKWYDSLKFIQCQKYLALYEIFSPYNPLTFSTKHANMILMLAFMLTAGKSGSVCCILYSYIAHKMNCSYPDNYHQFNESINKFWQNSLTLWSPRHYSAKWNITIHIHTCITVIHNRPDNLQFTVSSKSQGYNSV